MSPGDSHLPVWVIQFELLVYSVGVTRARSETQRAQDERPRQNMARKKFINARPTTRERPTSIFLSSTSDAPTLPSRRSYLLDPSIDPYPLSAILEPAHLLSAWHGR